MLNPTLSNFKFQFGSSFFPEKLVAKYNQYLHQKNTMFNNIESHIVESLQNFQTPGINLNTIAAQGLSNLGHAPYSDQKNGFPHSTINRTYPGTSPMNEVYDTVAVNLSYRNTILNWCYFYEYFYSYYKRSRDVDDFSFHIDMLDSAEIPMIRFSFYDCFISVIPPLEFNTASLFNETRTIDCSFVFNKFDINLIIPEFKQKSVNLKS